MDIKEKRILLVEDEYLPAMLEKKNLETLGYYVEHISSGKDAIQKILNKDKSFDVILMDIDLGSGMDGTQAAEEILKVKDIPIVFLSSHTEIEIVQKTEKITSYGYVVKNSGIVVLDASIKMALKLYHQKCEYRKSEKRIRELFERSRDGLVTVDRSGSFLNANQAYCDMLGYSLKELKEMENFYIITPEKWREWEHKEIVENRLLKDGFSRLYEKEYIRKDGTVFPIELQAYSVFDTEGNIQYIWGVVRDITERKKAEKELRNSEERFRSIIAVSNTGGWEYHRDRDYLWCSPEYFAMLGHDSAEFAMDGSSNLAETWINLIHPDDREKAFGHFAEYLANGSKGMYENYFRMKHRDDRWIWIWSRGQTLRDSAGKLTEITVGTHIDITQHKFYEDKLKLSERTYR